MKLILAIGLGSFLGGVSRYLLSELFKNVATQNFPFATFFVNIIGCFLIGLCFSMFEKNFLDRTWYTILTVGFLGGFTTFSAFSLDMHKLLKDQMYFYFVIYSFGSLFLGILATLIGYWMIKSF